MIVEVDPARESGEPGVVGAVELGVGPLGDEGLDEALRLAVRLGPVRPGPLDFAMGRGRTPEMPELAGMMAPEDVAETVMFVLTRPRRHRILEVALRPVTETSWG